MIFDPGSAERNKKAQIKTFFGLNRTGRGGAGEMSDMKNMSSFEYPFAAPRGARIKKCGTSGSIAAVCAPDSTDETDIHGFTGVCDEKFIYNGTVKSGDIRLGGNYKWSIIRLGRLYIINGGAAMRSVMYTYDPASDTFAPAGTVMDSLIVSSGKDSTGNYLSTIRYGFSAVRDHQYTDSDGNIVKNEDFYTKYCEGYSQMGSENIFGKHFEIGDEVMISGFPSASENPGQVWCYNTNSAQTENQSLTDYSYNNTVDTDIYSSVKDIDKYSIVTARVKGFKSSSQSVGGVVTYTHYIYFDLKNKNGEDMDFDNMSGSSYRHYCSGVTIEKRRRCFLHIAAHHGRVWGTSPLGNYIYASASDNIFSFSSDDIAAGFAARLVSDNEGCFTALAEYNGELYAFKHDSITVIGGTNVSNYNTYVINGMGCIDGNSVAVTTDGIIFLSHKGFCLCAGQRVIRISQALRTGYVSAAGGWDGELYRASAKTDTGATEFLCFDMQRGLWYLEDDTDARGFFRFHGDMYFASDDGVYLITEDAADNTEWEFTLCPADFGIFDNKAVNELWIKAQVFKNAQLHVYTSIAGGAFTTHGAYNKAGLDIIRVPVRAVNGYDISIKIAGKGRVIVRGIEFVTGTGGRKYL